MTRVEGSVDRLHMLRALELAARGWGRVHPNPLVGAVVVRDGEVMGEGWHSEYGMPHAEVEALTIAGESARGATLYVTLEPCSHHGKTPPCTDAVIAAGVARVVFAASDPNPKARGGAEVLRAAGIEVETGLEEAAALDLNAAFFHGFASAGSERPWTELKLALSLDARVADAQRRSAWLTGEGARAEIHRLRAGSDAIMVGIGTALADDPLLTVRGAVRPRQPPVRIVLDRRLRLSPGSRLVATLDEAQLWVICGPGADPDRRLALERAGVAILETPDLPGAMRLIREAGVRSVFCEGGARVASALLRDGLVDRLTLVYAPLLLGPDAVDPFAGLEPTPLDAVHRWRRLRTETFGDDTLVSLAP